MSKLAAESEMLKWNEMAEKRYQQLKDAVQVTVNLFFFFSRSDHTKLYADASPSAIGAVLVQINKEESCPVPAES